MALSETRLANSFYDLLKAQETAAKALPPENPADSIKRLASGLAKAVIDELKTGAEVAGQATSNAGTFTLTGKIN